jgi:uncharacterized protein YecE (DUF72 family)
VDEQLSLVDQQTPPGRIVAPGSHLVRIGTSGWSYGHWAGDFYPSGLPARDQLPFYASRFPTVEINATFYRLPSESTVRAWRERVPPSFVFAVKGSRLITHQRRLQGVDESLATFLSRIGLLGDALAVVLWQLPPSQQIDTALLDQFLGALPPGTRHAVEFRHRSWLVAEAFSVLRAHGAAHVHVSSDLLPADLTTTADFVYVRFHGLAAFTGAYPAEALAPWAAFLDEQRDAGHDAYVFFNNDAWGHAPRDAARLRELLALSRAA